MKTFQHIADKFEDSPSGPTAMYWIGKTLEAEEKPGEATSRLEQLLADHPQAAIVTHVHLALGNLYYAAEKWDQAIKHYRAIVEDPHPDQEILPSAMSNLIETYEVAGAYDGALTLTRGTSSSSRTQRTPSTRRSRSASCTITSVTTTRRPCIFSRFSTKPAAISKGRSGTTSQKRITIRAITSRRYLTS